MKAALYTIMPRGLFTLLLFYYFTTFAASFSSYSMQPRCHEDEHEALLLFKDSFTVSDYCNDPFQSWKPSKLGRTTTTTTNDCCSWYGVECDDETNHIISLDLSNTCLFGSINSTSSLFRLVHLRNLNLAYNDFNLSHIPPQIHNLSMLTHLNLTFSGFSGQIPSQIANLSSLISLDLSTTNTINQETGLKLDKLSVAELVQNLTNLKELHLSSVQILSAVPDVLANHFPLESLILDNCGLQGELPSGIFQLPNLKMLDLNGNSDLEGSFSDSIRRSTHLKTLRLSKVRFRGEILPDSIGNLGNLEELDISFCNFSGNLPFSLGNLTNLTILDLSNNNFWGQSSSLSWFDKLTKLTSLDLYAFNFISTNIPSQLRNLSQLSYIDLGYCQLTGPIPSWLTNLTDLHILILDHNQLIGKIPSWLMYQSNVEYLFLGSNQLSGKIPDENNTSLSQLSHLDISSNRLQGSIPSSLFKLKNLRILELHSNNLVGEVQLDMFLKLSSLKALSLSFNNLVLTTKISTNVQIQNLKFLGLASCNLTEFPSFLRYQDELNFLDLSSNTMHGQIPSWVWNISKTSLFFMNLSHNSLTGFEQQFALPIVVQWSHLTVLDLRSNMLQGSLSVPPSSTWRKNACKLRMINLSHNQLKGQVPRSLTSCSELELLDLSNNQLTDYFPSWLGTLPELKILILRSNNFNGVIQEHEPENKFLKLQIIDSSHNHFSGMLPAMYFKNWNAMKGLDASGIRMRYMGKNVLFTLSEYYTNYDYSMIMNNKGSELNYLKIPDKLSAIDFSNNHFQGQIPSLIGNLKALHLLNLSSNNLTGQIPSSLKNLRELESLDLSINKLSGEIPPQLAEMTFLSSLNVAYNRLEGPVPRGNQFDTFEEKSYEGNSGLCGDILKKKCGDVEAEPPLPEDYDGSGFEFEFGWKVVLLGYGCGFIIGAVTGYVFSRRNNGWLLKIFGIEQLRRRHRRTSVRSRNRG